MKTLWRLFFSFFSFFFTDTKTTRHITLDKTNFVSMTGIITTESVDQLIREWLHPTKIKDMKTNGYTVLYIDSYGGSVHAGTRVIEFIRSLQAKDIAVECIGRSFMSMAFVIMQTCDKRYVLQNSVGMQHQMSFGIRGSIESMRNYFDLNDQINSKLVDLQTKRIGIDKAAFEKKTAHDWWLYGEKNVKENVADETVIVSCSDDVSIEVCPLSTSCL